MRRCFFATAGSLLCALVVRGEIGGAGGRDVIFQVSSLASLFDGQYDGTATCGMLKRQGDFGLGCFDRLDGEMCVLHGRVFQIPADGRVREAADSALAPFASLTFFDADQTQVLQGPLSFEELKQWLDGILTDKDRYYAIRVPGRFSAIKVRSVPRQDKPYPKLAEALKNQTVFDLADVQGTLVGFWFPKYMDGATAGGYHFHFLTDDRSAGGHVLDCTVANGTAELDPSSEFRMVVREDAAQPVN